MKKSTSKIITVMLTFIIMSLSVFSGFSSAEESESKPNQTKVLEARFLNMLNHSYVYGEDFNSLDTIVNNSVVAVLEKDDTADSYIEQGILNAYLYDMFGIEKVDYSAINTDFQQKDGFVFIIPRGYTVYKHSPISISENDDGTYTFVTQVSVNAHDDGEEIFNCMTLFVSNPNSAFGYNIVSSELLTVADSL